MKKILFLLFVATMTNMQGIMAQEKITQTTAADGREAFQKEMIFPIGEPNSAYAQYFIGNSYLAPISTEQIPFNNVTFEPGCRNNWHIHHATKGGGQMLVCIAGRGWYQEEGKPAVQMLPGDVVHIPANVKHWHGAAADSWFAHLAFEVSTRNIAGWGNNIKNARASAPQPPAVFRRRDALLLQLPRVKVIHRLKTIPVLRLSASCPLSFRDRTVQGRILKFR